MNPEDIKIGERVSLSGYIANKTDKHFYITIHTGFNEYTKIKVAIPSLELYEITPENGKTNTESAPKYDPCRKFRKGDKVRVVEYKGRKNTICIPVGAMATVAEDEEDCACVEVFIPDEETESVTFVDPAYLELVTPVEELEPYCVKKYRSLYAVERIDNHYIRPATYDIEDHPHAKEAAEAECARLNEEFRKKRLDVLKRQNEEPESYGLSSHTDGKCVDWHVTEKDGFICTSFHARPHGAYTPSAAREAAQAECDRLNAEYRKEQK